MDRHVRRYLNRVGRDRERIAREERHARGERTENEKWAADLVERVRREKSSS
jgi:hypothetical protein